MSVPTMLTTATSIAQILGDGADVDSAVDAAALAGMTFDFICNIPAGRMIPGPGDSTWLVAPVKAVVNPSGVLCRVNADGSTGAAGVALLAADAVSLTAPLQWKVRPGRVQIGARTLRPRAWWFNARDAGTTTPLRSLLPVDGTIAMPTSPGAGPGGDMQASTYDPNNRAADAFDRANHHGAQPQSSITDLPAALTGKVDKVAGKGLSSEDYTAAEKSKLGGVAPNATQNASDAALRDRALHTGQQSPASIADLAEFIRDAIGAALVAGANIDVSVNDAADTITIGGVGGGSGGLDAEAVRDVIGAAIGGQGLIGVLYNDALDTIVITTSATQNATDAALRDRSTHTGVQPVDSVDGLPTLLAGKRAATRSGTVGTAAGTVAKTTSIAEPVAGEEVELVYTNGNTAGGVTVSFNGGAARSVRLRNATASVAAHDVAAGGRVRYVFDGTYLQMLGSQMNLSVDQAAAASTLMQRTPQGNAQADVFINGVLPITAAAGSTPLTNDSAGTVVVTGTTTHTVVEATTGIAAGWPRRYVNLSTGALTVTSSGGGTIAVMAQNETLVIEANQTTPTTAAHWSVVGGTWLSNAVAAASVPKALVDAKGDLFVASADNTVVRLPVGADGQVVTADSTQPSGLKYATPAAGAGSVQVVSQLFGNGSTGPFDINHGKNTFEVMALVREVGGNREDRTVTVTRPNSNTVRLSPDVVISSGSRRVTLFCAADVGDVTPPPSPGFTYVSKTSNSITAAIAFAGDAVAAKHYRAGVLQGMITAAGNVTFTNLSSGTTYSDLTATLIDAEGNESPATTLPPTSTDTSQPVAFDAVSGTSSDTGSQDNFGNTTPITVAGNCILAFLAVSIQTTFNMSSFSQLTVDSNLSGSLPLIPNSIVYEGGGTASGPNHALACFGKVGSGVVAGDQILTSTVKTNGQGFGSSQLAAMSEFNVGGIGTPVRGGGNSAAPSLTVASQVNAQVVSAFFAQQGAVLTGYNGNNRKNIAPGGGRASLQLGDRPGADSVTLSLTNTGIAWGGVAIPLPKAA